MLGDVTNGPSKPTAFGAKSERIGSGIKCPHGRIKCYKTAECRHKAKVALRHKRSTPYEENAQLIAQLHDYLASESEPYEPLGGPHESYGQFQE